MSIMKWSLPAHKSDRWTKCTASPMLEGYIGIYSDSEPNSEPRDFAKGSVCGSRGQERGREFHQSCHEKLLATLVPGTPIDTADCNHLDKSMDNLSGECRNFVLAICRERWNSTQEVRVLSEHSLVLPLGNRIVCRGRVDCAVLTSSSMDVIDYKTSLQYAVPSEDNSQLMLYAASLLKYYPDCDPEIRLIIFQPGMHHTSYSHITKAELLKWLRDVAEPVAEQIAAGTITFKVGDHCQFCAAKAYCRARLKDTYGDLTPLGVPPEASSPILSVDEISRILSTSDRYSKLIEEFRRLATEYLRQGIPFPHYKLVHPYSKQLAFRKKDQRAVIQTAQSLGVSPYKETLCTPKELAERLGQETFNQYFAPLTSPYAYKPKLVPESDPRPAITVSPQEDSHHETI